MATCVASDVNGFLYATPDAVESCTGSILLSQPEFLTFSQSIEGEEIITIADIFTIPEAALLAQAFATSFTLIMICYIVAYAFGQVINFFHPENERY